MKNKRAICPRYLFSRALLEDEEIIEITDFVGDKYKKNKDGE